MPEDEKIGGALFGIGLLVGTVLAHLTIFNFWGVELKDFNVCISVCKPHGGMSHVYPDNDCKCVNGMSIDPSQYKQPEEK